MNLGNKLAIIFASVSIIVLIICAVLLKNQDKEAPTIAFEKSDVTYQEGMDTIELLKGVSAKDKCDGDVTNKIVIEKITKTSSGKSVIVTYAAGDKANNFAKASRIFTAKILETGINKSDSKSTVQIGDTEKAASDIPVTPEADTDEEDIKPEEQAEEDNPEGEQADNQQEDEKPQGEQPAEEANAKNPVLQLSASETVLKKGTAFNVNDYIAQLSDDVDSTESLQHRVRAEGAFDNNVPGDYPITIMVTDSEGNFSQAQSLMIHVVD